MSFFDEAIPMIRALIGDVGPTLSYSDARLEEVLCVAAKLLLSDNITFDYSYTVSISTHSISPDPVDSGDNAFLNFVCLKASCIMDISQYRTKAAVAGISAKLGPASLDTRDHIKGFLDILNTDGGPCKAYERLKFEHMFGNAAICKVILSPFVSNEFDPQSLSNNISINSDRGRLID